jgi:hypothetical protein
MWFRKEDMQFNSCLHISYFWICCSSMYVAHLFWCNATNMPLQCSLPVLLANDSNIFTLSRTFNHCLPYVQKVLLRPRSWWRWLYKGYWSLEVIKSFKMIKEVSKEFKNDSVS